QVRMVENTPKKGPNKTGRNSIAQAAGQDLFPFKLRVFAFLQIAFFDEKPGVSLGDAHAAPDFRDQEADVMVDPYFRPNMSRRGDESIVTREQIGDECVVEINDWQ